MAMLRVVTGSLRKGESERSHGTILLTCRGVLGGRKAATPLRRAHGRARTRAWPGSSGRRGAAVDPFPGRRSGGSGPHSSPARSVEREPFPSRRRPLRRPLAPQSIPFASRVRCLVALGACRRGTALGRGLLAAGPASADPTPQSRRARFAPAAHSSSGGRPNVSRSRTSRSRTRSVRGHVFAGSVQLAKHVRAGGPLHHGDGWGQTGPGDSP